MDRLVLLRDPRGRSQQDATPSEEVREDDIADVLSQYIPRSRADFPPLAYQPCDTAPTRVRFSIVDRVFDEFEVPIYILRPWRGRSREEDEEDQSLRTLLVADLDEDVEIKSWDHVALLHGTRSAQTTPTASTRDTSTSTAISTSKRNIKSAHPRFTYDADDPSLERIDLFEIERYVSPRELEDYENWRFEHPQDIDRPVVAASSSRASSEIQRQIDRDARAEVRKVVKDVKEIKRRGRPPKKVKKSGGSTGISVLSEERSNEMSLDTDCEPDPLLVDEQDAANEMILDEIVGSIEAMTDRALDEREMLAAFQNVQVTKSARSDRVTSQRSQRSKTRSKSAELHKPTIQARLASSHQADLKPLHGGAAGDVRNAGLESSALRTIKETGAAKVGYGQVPPQNIAQKMRRETTPAVSKAAVKPVRAKSKSLETSLHESEYTTSSTSNGHQAPRTKTALSDSEMTKTSKGKQKKKSELLIHEKIVVPPDQEHEAEVEEEYEISHIVGHDDSSGTRYYLVAWVGYADSEATWLTGHELQDAPVALEEYLNNLAAEGEAGYTL